MLVAHKLADQNNFALSNVSYVFSEKTFCSVQKLEFEMGLDLGNILELYVEIWDMVIDFVFPNSLL